MTRSLKRRATHRALLPRRGRGRRQLLSSLSLSLLSLSLSASLCLIASAGWGAPAVECPAGEWPCSSQAESATVQPVRPLFKVQLRVSQGENFIAEGLFPEVFATLSTAQAGSCEERFTDVYVRQSVLNLELGQNMDCDLERFVQENDNLRLQLCLGNRDSCVTVPLATVPYAMKANSVRRAELAGRVNRVRQAHYAHRLASDPTTLTESDALGMGFIDFHTRAWDGVLQRALGHLGEALRFETGGGFLLWNPVGDTAIMELVIAARAEGGALLQPLNELIFLGERLYATGHLTVEGFADGDHDAAEIEGHSHLQGGLEQQRALELSAGDMLVEGTATLEGALLVSGETKIRQGARVGDQLTVSGDTHVHGEVQAGPTWSGAETLVGGEGILAGQLTVSGESRVTGDLAATSAQVEGSVLVGEGSSLLQGALTLSDALEVGENGAASLLTVQRALRDERGLPEEQLVIEGSTPVHVPSTVTFSGPVEFAGGVSPSSPFTDCTLSPDLQIARRDRIGEVTTGRVDGVYAVTCNGRTFNLSQFTPDSCGDERVTSGEDCDLGDANSDEPDAACRSNCREQRCGDAIVDSGEECDDANDIEDDRCTRTCEINDRCKPTLLPGSELTTAGLVTINLSDEDRSSNISPGCAGGGPQEVVKLSVQEESAVVFETISGEFDTALHLRDDCSSDSSLACNDDGGVGLLSRISWPSRTREEGPLYLVVDSFRGAGRGNTQVAVMVRCPERAPAHSIRSSELTANPDTGAKRIELPFNTTPAAGSAGDPRAASCPDDPNPPIGGAQAAIELILTERSQVEAKVSGMSPGYDSYLLLKQSCTMREAIACDDDGNNAEQQYASRISSVLDAGVYYFILDGYRGSEGAGTLTVTLSAAP